MLTVAILTYLNRYLQVFLFSQRYPKDANVLLGAKRCVTVKQK